MIDDRDWMLGPFQREDAANPCLTPSPAALFSCPVRGEMVRWEEKDVFNPAAVLRRSRDYFIRPEKEYEITGQIGNVCFLEGLVHFKRRWLLYYGTADSKIAVAGAPAPDSPDAS
jgi:hypothetical protein